MSIDKKGDRWRVRLMVKGQKYQRYFTTHKDAEDWEQQLRFESAEPDWKDQTQANLTTLKEMLTDYANRLTPQKKGARQEWQRIRAWMLTPLSNMNMTDIRVAHVQAWIDERIKEGKAPTTINNAINVLSQVFQEAARKRGFDGLENPCERVRRAPSRKPVYVVVGEDDLEKIIYASRLPESPYLEWMVRLAITTGLRQGELRAIRWCDILPRKVLLHDTKNGDAQERPLSLEARGIFDEWKKFSPYPQGPRDLVFPVTNHQVQGAYAGIKRKLEAKYGHSFPTFHNLRKVFTDMAAKKLPNALALARALGHRSPLVTYRYYNPDAGDLSDLLDKDNKG